VTNGMVIKPIELPIVRPTHEIATVAPAKPRNKKAKTTTETAIVVAK